MRAAGAIRSVEQPIKVSEMRRLNFPPAWAALRARALRLASVRQGGGVGAKQRDGARGGAEGAGAVATQRADARAAAEEPRLATSLEPHSLPLERLVLRLRRLVLPLFALLPQAHWTQTGGRMGAIRLDAPS